MFEKEKYERPVVEVIEFELSDSTALSGEQGILGYEEIWGEK